MMDSAMSVGIKIGLGSSSIPLYLRLINDGNTVAWYTMANIIESGGVVSQMTDISGNESHLTQSDPTKRPTLTASGVLFDGVDDYLSASFTLGQPEMIYAVVKHVTWTLADRLWDGLDPTSMYVNQRGTTPNLGMNTTSGTGLNNNNNLTLDTYGIIRVLYDGANSFLDIDGNRVSGGTVATGSANGFTLGGGGFHFLHTLQT